MYLGSQGSITGGALPSLPSVHQKYSSSDLPSLINDVLDDAYGNAVQQLQTNPKLAVEQFDDGSFNALQWAAMFGANNFIDLFFNHGLQLNLNSKYPPLHLAVMQNHSGAAEMLLKLGAQVALRSTKGLTPFLHAVDEGHLALAALLLSAGADVNDRVLDSPLQIPALGFASMRGETGLVELMLRKGADRGALSGQSHTPLIFAAAANHLTVVDLLLKQAADTTSCPVSFAKECRINDKETGKGRSALLWAITGDPSGKRVSVHRSAGRPKAPGYNPPLDPPFTQEQERMYETRQVRLVETLLFHGSDPNAVDKSGCSALYLAATENYDAMRKLRTHMVASDAQWPVGRPDLVETLLRGGATPRTTKNEHGQVVAFQESEAARLIQWAVERGYAEVLRLIIFPPPFVPLNVGEDASRVLDVARLSLRNGASLLDHALTNKAWLVAELLILGGCKINGTNVEPLLEEHRRQLGRGQELSPEQIAVHLQLLNVSPVICSKLKYLGFGSGEIRELPEQFFVDRIQSNETEVRAAWTLLQELLQRNIFSYLRSLLT